MEQEYITLSFIRLVLIAFSFFALPRSVLMLKTAWQANDATKIRKSITLLWAAIIAGCLFLKMVKGIS